MRQGANEQGAWDVGCLPDRLPGYAPVVDDQAREALEQAWGCSIPSSPGLGLAEIVEASRNGGVKAAMLIGDSVNFTNGKLDDGVNALEQLEFLVVHDTFLGQAAQVADVVLPRVTFAEKDGTFTNLERRIQRLRASINVKNNDGRPESWLFCELARRMGASGFDYFSPDQVMDEIARLCPIYGGVSYQRLEDESRLVLRTGLDSPQPTQVLQATKEHRGIQWPCVDEESPSQDTLYVGGFQSSKADPATPEFRIAPSDADEGFTAWLVPGRVLLQSHREMQIVKGKRNRIERQELVEFNPADAMEWSIGEGDPVEVQAGDGLFKGEARLTEAVPQSVISVTSIFGQLAVELQASEDPDAASKVPGLDIRRAKVTKIDA